MAAFRWSHADYSRLEAAIAAGTRVVVVRQGGELIIVPRRLRMRSGREIIEAIHPATGEIVTFALDEIDPVHVLP